MSKTLKLQHIIKPKTKHNMTVVTTNAYAKND